MFELICILATLFFSMLITGLMRQFSAAYQLMDIPNERSSHTEPTASGGGVAIVLSFLLAIGFLYAGERLSGQLCLAFLLGAVIALAGLWDDVVTLSALKRLLLQFACVSIMLTSFGGIPAPSLIDSSTAVIWAVNITGMVLLVWLINLYNFMDGIDGLAGTEAVTVTVIAALILISSDNTTVSLMLLLLAASVIGFLVWNWPPAKIFMGDAGSSFLGYILGVFIVLTITCDLMSVWTWMILLGVFLMDASLTLFIRLLSGKEWYKPHRSHAYQRAAQEYGSHKTVTLAVILINTMWLAPLAWLSTRYKALSLVLVFMSYLPLILLALRYKCGRVDTRLS